MGLLADIFSTADTAKRRLGGLLADPLGTLALGITRFGEDQGGLLNMAQNAYPMAGNKTVLNTPQQIASFRQQVADQGANQAMSAATVWHGSPHKFDKFDSSKIGTGEGAQAYGHGLYLAESPMVAGQYAESVKDMGAIQRINAELSDLAKRMSADEIPGSYRKYRSDAGRQASQRYDELMNARDGVRTAPGSLYKVDLPDEHIAKMLDWDKPLSQQPKNVRDAYRKYLKSPEASEYAKNWTRYSEGMKLDQAEPLLKNPGGENLYKNAFPSRDFAHQWANENGIPGIRYLDGGSRGGGAGTSNFVVFPGNEGLLQILERNGQALK